MRLAQLPWYVFSFLAKEHARLWSHVRAQLECAGIEELPQFLDLSSNLDAVLRNPKLLLSQTCGYDIAAGSPGPLTMVATPVYSAPGCGAGTYSSFIVARESSPFRSLGELHGARFIANDDRSWSGYHCVREYFPCFEEILFSGGHSLSLKALASGTADVAAIDCLVWELLRRNRPQALVGIRILGLTPEAYAPPLVTRASVTEHELRALRVAIKSFAVSPECARDRERLLIRDFLVLRPEVYTGMASRNEAKAVV